MRTLEDWNRGRTREHLAPGSEVDPRWNGIECPQCKEQLADDRGGGQMLSLPPRVRVWCPNCGFRSTRVA